MPVYATITAPVDLEPGKYTTSFSVACSPLEQGAPVGALGSYGGISFGVSVVEERTRPNPYVPEKETKLNMTFIASVILLIAVLLILSLYLVRQVLKRK